MTISDKWEEERADLLRQIEQFRSACQSAREFLGSVVASGNVRHEKWELQKKLTKVIDL